MILENLNIVLKDKIISGDLIIENGIIKKILPKKENKNTKNYIMPGFIDPHIHGSNNSDTMDGTLKSLDTMAKSLPRFGTTAFLPTTVTDNEELILNATKNVAENKDKIKGAIILGVNLEGPFISPHYIGAQNPNFLKDINLDLLKKFNYKNIIKIITVAPELKNFDKLAKYAKDNNIVISLGHSDATYEEVINANKLGAKLFTHAYNAMRKLNHREVGMVGAMLLNNDMYAELILDLIHVNRDAINLLIKNKGTDKIILITDAMKAQGIKTNKSSLASQDVFIKNGAARLKDGQLAGSILTQDISLKNLVNNFNIDLPSASKMLSLNIAKLLNLSNMGEIKEGFLANLVILDDKLNIKKTYIKGELAYENK